MKPAVYHARRFSQSGVASAEEGGIVVFTPSSVVVLATDFNADSDVLVAVTMDDGNTAVLYVTYDAWREFKNN